jgi:exonuclease VII small subunit
MNMKRLSENIVNIEHSITQFKNGKASYDDCLDNLLSFGYSFKEAVIILRNNNNSNSTKSEHE